jgi:hypothetical protein
MTRRSALFTAVATGLLAACLPSLAAAQEAKSVAVAKQLAQALTDKKLDAIAAKYPSEPDRFVAALYFPGVQLLVISGTYSAPQLMDPRIALKQYRDIYLDLGGTSPKDSKIFVQDMGAPGLTSKKVDGLFDSWTQGDKQIVFDGDWDKQKISESDYQKTFAAADEEYTKILTALLAEAKK